MAERKLIPSIEQRMRGYIEVSRRNITGLDPTAKPHHARTITLSREFGCEGYPTAERLKELLDKRTGETWTIMDKGLLEAVAKDHHLSAEMLNNLGSKNRFLDDMLSTFSSRWPSDKDYYRILSRQIIALAERGNMIIVGRGGSILTQHMPFCFHFRIVASQAFKVRTIARRLELEEGEAERLVAREQKQRDGFIRDFLSRDVADLTLYHLTFTNDKSSAAQIAASIDCFLASR